MKRLILLAIVASTGCYRMTSFAVLDQALPTLEGRPISDVVLYLGYPTSERTMMGKKIYVWSTAYTSVTPSITTTTGTVAGAPVAVTSSGVRSSNLACEVRAITSNEVVEGFEYAGNNGACAQFARALQGRLPQKEFIRP